MKKILLQLDTDRFASPFDRIVALDAGADAVTGYGGVRCGDVRGLVQGAMFTRGAGDLAGLAVWIGGSDADEGERMLEQVRQAFFGPFRMSVMLDSNGCNTTASTAVALLGRRALPAGQRALVIGPGPVGVRAALLLAGEGCRVVLAPVPRGLLGDRYDRELAGRTLGNARRAAAAFSAAGGGTLEVAGAGDGSDLDRLLDGAGIVCAAGPAGLRLLPRASWEDRPGLGWLVDFNLVEPLGIEGVRPEDDGADRGGRRMLGALAIGNFKMKVHKACVAGLFEANDRVLDAGGVYRVARGLL